MTQFKDEKKLTRSQVLQIMSERTGLHKNTIKDLMKNGWEYRESLDEPLLFIKQNPIKRGNYKNA